MHPNSTPLLPLISINPLRMGIDGKGVTTLIAAAGCPLRCKYCLNAEILRPNIPCRPVAPKQLVELVSGDHLYFLATGGGITFGGGESLLHTDFIRAFRAVCPPLWKLTVETSLNVPGEALKNILDTADEFIVDIKDMNTVIYEAYTGVSNAYVLANLKLLIRHADPSRIKVRIPFIPGMNTAEDTKKSTGLLKDMGYDNIEVFHYIVRNENILLERT